MTAADNEELDALQRRLVGTARLYNYEDRTTINDANDAITALRARVAELEQANAQLSGESTEWIVKLRETESQLQQVKADAERIDWLEATIRKSGDIEYANGIRDALDHEYQHNGGDLRVAIDKTRRNDA